MTPVSKNSERRKRSRARALDVLRGLLAGTADVYESYRVLYVIWCGNNAAEQELRPLFRMPGISPDGPLSVTDEFKQNVVTLAAQILPTMQD